MANCLKLVLLCLLLFSIHECDAAKKKKKSNVKIAIESRPSDCTDEASKGDTVLVHYTGSLESGQIFDTSKREGREPFSLVLGQGQVIPGWEEGLLGMCVGEERRLTIPPHLGYGSRGVEGIIPPDSVLIFDIELLEIKKPSLLGNIQSNSNTGLYTLLGVLLVISLIGYELYKRYNNDTTKSTTKATSSKKKRGKKR